MISLRTIGWIALLGLAPLAIACESTSSDPNGPQQVGTCVPDCHFRQCGDNGCGGSCGGCAPGLLCTDFQCLAPGQNPVPVPDAGHPSSSDAGTDLGPDAATPIDQDGDGVNDSLDNCPNVYNPTQADQDEDWMGDACDPDIDGDDALNDLDCAPTDPTIHPYAREYCDTGVDENCNGVTDEENAWDCEEHFIDADGDGCASPVHLYSIRMVPPM